MTSTLNYTALLPLNLQSELDNLTRIYGQDSLPALDKAFFGLFPGIPGTTPDIVSVRNQFMGACQDALPAIRDISTYSDVFTAIIPGLGNDKDAIVATLRSIVGGWKSIDIHSLTNRQEQIYRIIDAYPATDDIVAALNEFVDELQLPPASGIHPPYYDKSIFDIVAPILAPVAKFPDSDVSKAQLADLLHLRSANVSQLLRDVLNPPITAPKVTAATIAGDITKYLITPIESYAAILHDITRDFDSLVHTFSAVSTGMIAVSRGIELFAQGNLGASTSTSKTTTADEVVAAWNAVGPSADAFVNVIAGGRPSSGSAIRSARVSRANRGSPINARHFNGKKLHNIKPQTKIQAAFVQESAEDITKQDVTNSFGPPPAYTAQTLPDMNATTGKIVADFQKIMTMPFIDQLKVTGSDGNETSLGAVMLTCKKKYEALQLKTVPIVRDLYAYADLQQTILPGVNTPNGISLNDFLVANQWLVTKYGASAKQIATDTKQLLDEFQAYHEMLLRNLNEINQGIAANKSALSDAQAQYNATLATSIIEGLIFAVATTVAVIGLATGQSELAIGMGITAGTSFATMIADAVAADKLSDVIANLKSIIRSSTETANQLQQVIPVFQNIIELMSQISDIWESIDSSLTGVKEEYALWSNPAYFTTSMVKDAISSWANVQAQCLAYTLIVSGGTPPPTTPNLLAAHFATPTAKVQSARLVVSGGKPPPPPYDVHTDPQAKKWFNPTNPADRKWKFQAFVQAQKGDDLLTALLAPEFTLSCNQAQLSNAATHYSQAASTFRRGGWGFIWTTSPVGDELENLSATISDTLIPALNAAVAFYVTFAAGQNDPFAEPLTKDRLIAIADARWTQLSKGSDLAKAAEIVFITYQGASQLALDHLNAKINTQNIELKSKHDSIEDHKRELAKYDWVKWWPIPPGLGAAINAIVASIKGDESRINELNDEINKLTQTRDQFTFALNIVAPARNLTTALSQNWSALTTQTHSLQTFTQLLEADAARDALYRPLVQKSWKKLSDDLAGW